jgi:antitoxin (DNA-binding transcriptional repressor) of toxin-antitoxin stability system
MISVNLNDFAHDTVKYINLVKNGEEITIIDEKFPIIITKQKINDKRQRPLGLGKGEFITPENFNDNLPDEIISSFEGR